MKLLCCVLCMCVAIPAVYAQDETDSEWRVMPSLSLVKYFEGETIFTGTGPYDVIYPPYSSYFPSTIPFKYAGTGLSFNARCFNDEIKPLALTFGGGITWYYEPDHSGYAMMSPSPTGVGAMLRREDFTAFPISVGVQAVFPYARREKLMVFAGAEANVHLISGDVPIGDQAKAGYSVLGGVAVKFVEFGVKYTVFSDIKNLGAYFGLRFNSFGM